MNEFPKNLRWFVAILATGVVVIAAALARLQPFPSWQPLLVFGLLVLFAEHRVVDLPNGMRVSAGFMVNTAFIVVFVAEGAWLGALILGVVGGIYLPQMKRRLWPWIPLNSAMLALACFAACASFAALPTEFQARLPLAAIGLTVLVAAYVFVSWIVLAVVYRAVRQVTIRETITQLLPGALQVLCFALPGFLLGRLYLSLGAGITLLIIVPIIIARETYAAYTRIKESHEETVHLLIRALESKDNYTAGHAERVATYARYMGEELNFMPARLERLRFAALMHDIGKLVVPNHILNKPGRLTPQEFEKVKMHERVGVQMLSHIDFLQPIVPTVHAEAMHFDPDDLDHPIEPYIVMIADAFDAMTSTRAYRKALTQDIAFEELRDKAGIQFHPQCVESLISGLHKRGERHGKGFELQSEFEHAPETGVGSAGLGDLLDIESG